MRRCLEVDKSARLWLGVDALLARSSYVDTSLARGWCVAFSRLIRRHVAGSGLIRRWIGVDPSLARGWCVAVSRLIRRHVAGSGLIRRWIGVDTSLDRGWYCYSWLYDRLLSKDLIMIRLLSILSLFVVCWQVLLLWNVILRFACDVRRSFFMEETKMATVIFRFSIV